MPLFDKLADAALHDGILILRGSFPKCPEEGADAIAWTDGLTIRISEYVDDDQGSWAAAHLYGHCMAWADNPHSRQWDLNKRPATAGLIAIRNYEAKAGCFGLHLVTRVTPKLIPWFVDRSVMDWLAYREYLMKQGYTDGDVKLGQLLSVVPQAVPTKFEPGWAFALTNLKGA